LSALTDAAAAKKLDMNEMVAALLSKGLASPVGARCEAAATLPRGFERARGMLTNVKIMHKTS
jgi:hypothetical protein